MNLKQIVNKALIVGGLVVALNGFPEQPEMPVVDQSKMGWIMYGQHEDGSLCVTIGYDTEDNDRIEDTRFHYKIILSSDRVTYTELIDYGIDLDRDGYFKEDEWFKYIPPIEERNGNGVKPKKEKKGVYIDVGLY